MNRAIARRAATAVLLVVTLVGLSSVQASAAPMPGSGSISGQVNDTSGPLSGICVWVENGPMVMTDGAGAYSIGGLTTGSYKLQFVDCNAGPTHVTQWYIDHPDANGAELVAVIDGANPPLPVVTLSTGIVVSGTVTDTHGSPLGGVNVSISTPDGGPPVAGAQSNVDGTYSTGPIPAGSYRVQFSDGALPPVWATQYWSDQPSSSTASTLILDPSDGPIHGGVDAHLTVGASLSGTVTGPAGEPVSGVCVSANTSNNGRYDWLAGQNTLADGTYRFSGLPAISVKVSFHDCNPGGSYIDQWFGGSNDPESSPTITLGDGEDRVGVDAQLTTGIAVAGRVTDNDGNPIQDITINVNPDDRGPGGWAMTDTNGEYRTNAVPAGTYQVKFQDSSPTPIWATGFWGGATSSNDASPLVLSGSDAPVRTGVDAILSPGGTVTGTVTAPAGGPVANICVLGSLDGADGGDWIAYAATRPDGTYTLGGLPTTGVKVKFQDCNQVGSYVDQWWHDQTDRGNAEVLTLAAGETRSGIDAHLRAAAQIGGTVRDEAGNPIEGICVEAHTGTAFGALSTTGSDGTYALSLARAGDYLVQFVDCQHGTFAATTRTVSVADAQIVGGIDATLAPGAVGSISGHVVNVDGAAMTTACVVAFIPDKFILFAPVESDGSFEISSVPSGTYALGFLDCSRGEPGLIVADPTTSGLSYQAVFWNGVPLEAHGDDVDPYALGANLVTVTPGAHVSGYDWCFGCTAITITSTTPGPDSSLIVAFTTSERLLASARGQVTSLAASRTYTVTCTSTDGGTTGTATGTGSPITVGGLTDGATYRCQVTASDGGSSIGASITSLATVLSVTTPGDLSPTTTAAPAAATSPAAAPTTANPTSAAPTSADPTSEAPTSLAYTGANPTGLISLGALLVLVGSLFLATARRRRLRSSVRASLPTTRSPLTGSRLHLVGPEVATSWWMPLASPPSRISARARRPWPLQMERCRRVRTPPWS